MSNDKSLNSLLYDMYKLKKQYGDLVEQVYTVKNESVTQITDMYEVEKLFDKFYSLLHKEKYSECENTLEYIMTILGENNSDVIRAKTMLAFERD